MQKVEKQRSEKQPHHSHGGRRLEDRGRYPSPLAHVPGGLQQLLLIMAGAGIPGTWYRRQSHLRPGLCRHLAQLPLRLHHRDDPHVPQAVRLAKLLAAGWLPGSQTVSLSQSALDPDALSGSSLSLLPG